MSASTERAQRVAQDRHRRLHNERVAAEQAIAERTGRSVDEVRALIEASALRPGIRWVPKVVV